MIRIIIADDHAIVRRGFIQIMGAQPGFQVVGEASSTQELMALIRKQPCEVVVLDISMPGRSGLEALRDIKQEKPKVAVLILSMHAEEQFALRAIRAGASGYLTKKSAPEELVSAINKLASGGRYISAAIAETLASVVARDVEGPPHDSLSEREFQVMQLIVAGRSLTEIGEELAISVKTVSTYRSRILEKMRLKNNAELIHYAIQNRLTD